MFKAGDIVTGTSPDDYYITTDKAKLAVLAAQSGWIRVKLLSHSNPDFACYIGHEYGVDPDKFVKVRMFKGNTK